MSQTLRAVTGIPLPYWEIALGGVAWVAGAMAFGAGAGTVLMALGLGATGLLVAAVRRRHGLGARLDAPTRRKILQLVGVAAALVVALALLLPLIGQGWGELTVPSACAVIGVVHLPMATLLGERSFVAVGSTLIVLGAIGCVVALNTLGAAYPLGVVGIGGAGVAWLAGCRRIGLFGELFQRVGR